GLTLAQRAAFRVGLREAHAVVGLNEDIRMDREHVRQYDADLSQPSLAAVAREGAGEVGDLERLAAVLDVDDKFRGDGRLGEIERLQGQALQPGFAELHAPFGLADGVVLVGEVDDGGDADDDDQPDQDLRHRPQQI
ncbi:unnamed protein product, partial [Phaeothamnion confervicola]